MELFGLPHIKGPRLAVWRSSFAHPRSTHRQTIQTHWFNYQAEVFCPLVAVHGTEHASDEKRMMAETNDAFAPTLNLGPGRPRYWDAYHSSTTVEEGDDTFFYLLRCQLVDLLHPNFVARYMKTGQFTAISVGASIDRHNVAAIAPLGGVGTATLILSVDKDTYEQLGLEGKKSIFKGTCRYNIHVDLTAPHFVPGKKFFERVRWCLSERLTDIDLLAFWSVDGKTKKMEFAQAVKARPLKLREMNRLYKGLSVPILDESVLTDLFASDAPTATAEAVGQPQEEKKKETEKMVEEGGDDFIGTKVEDDEEEEDDDDGDEEEEEEEGGGDKKKMDKIEKVMKQMELGVRKTDGNVGKGKKRGGKKSTATSDEARAFMADLFEYLGLVYNSAIWGLDSSVPREQRHEFVSLDRYHLHAKGMHYKWRGLIPPSFVEDLLAKARKLVDNKAVPWAAVTVTGFEDAPVSWGKNEHGAGDVPPGGENDYTFVVLPNDQYWLYSATGKNDTYTA